jgi:hypothetical protein
MMTREVVAAEAAAIGVPVLIGCGEPGAYRVSRDISVAVIPGMSDMHNFARTPESLWKRIHASARSVGDGVHTTRSWTA